MQRFLAALTLLATPCLADEPVSFDVYLGPGAMICDEPDSVMLSLERGALMPDCGFLRLRPGAGVSVTVTILGYYEDKPLAMFQFHEPFSNVPAVQYGWWAGEIPEPVPQGISI